jgi:hypothetical protein
VYTGPVRGLRLCGLLLLASCFDASIPDGMLRCEADRDRPCPEGMVCRNGACYAEGTVLDLGAPSEAGADQSPDGPSLGPLTCGAPVVVGSASTPAKGLYEVALRADGRSLVALAPDTGLYWEITRPAVGQAFGAWTKTAATFLAERRDPTFFTAAGQELALVAAGDVPRHLELCTVPFDAGDCAPISVIDTKDGKPIALDMDGPSVAALPGGGLLMVHNVAHAGAPEPNMTGDVFLAKPVDAASPAGNWLSTAVPGMVSPTEVESDPALGPDGLVLLYSVETSPGDEDLMVAERQDTESAFSAPRPLEALNTDGYNEHTPDLGPLPAGGLELFFSSDRDGVRQIYRAECSR